MLRLLFLLFFTFPLFSQTQVFVGLQKGWHGSTLDVDHTLYSLNMNTGIQTNGLQGVTVKINKKTKDQKVQTGIQIDVNYLEKGWSQSFRGVEIEKFKQSLTYIQVPSSMMIYYDFKKVKPFGLAGIYIEKVIDDSFENMPVADSITNFDFYYYDSNRDRKWGYGMVFGGGFFKDFNFGQIQLEGYYQYSLSNLFEYEARKTNIPDQSHHLLFGGAIKCFFRIL